ncbi:unnamed protein product, partial [Brassica rapa]
RERDGAAGNGAEKKIIRPVTGPKPARVKPSPFTAPDSDGMKALSECKLERLLAQRAAASANFLTKEMPSPRDSNQRVRSRNRDTAFQARLQREDISRLLVSEERSERRRRGVRLYQDSDAAFASAFGGCRGMHCLFSVC